MEKERKENQLLWVEMANQAEMVKLAYQVEMDEMVVMEILDLVDLQAEMAMTDQKVTWENRDLLDPGVEESLMSGGVEPLAQTQLELNLSMLDEPLDLPLETLVDQTSTCAYQKNLNTKIIIQGIIPFRTLQYMVLSMNLNTQISHWAILMLTMSPVLSAIPLSESQS